jgi:hypothetical protein
MLKTFIMSLVFALAIVGGRSAEVQERKAQATVRAVERDHLIHIP